MSVPEQESLRRAADDAQEIRRHLALLSAETKLVRVRHLLRKYSPDQPRAPAGQSDGGRWVGAGSGGGDRLSARWASLSDDDSGSQTPRRTVLEGGGEVLSIRVRAGRGEWDEQHRIVTPESESRIFENSGATQTIRDGQTGEVLSRTTLTASGIEAEPIFQPAFAPALPLVYTTTIELAALLFTLLRAREPGFGPVLGMTAQGYDFDPQNKTELPVPWVGRVSDAALAQFCPRSGEVQRETDKNARRIREQFPRISPQDLGNMLHFDLAEHFRRQQNPNMKAELSLDGSEEEARYGAKGPLRLDRFELTPQGMVCVYDYKTGKQGLSASRALALAHKARLYYPKAKAIVIIQVRPQVYSR